MPDVAYKTVYRGSKKRKRPQTMLSGRSKPAKRRQNILAERY